MILSEQSINRLSEPGLYFCSLQKGFGVRCYENGSKSYVIGFRKNKKWRLRVIGKVGAISFKAAMIQARGLLGAQSSDKHSITTIAERYYQHHALLHHKRPSEVRAYIDQYIDPMLGSVAIHDLKISDCVEFHAKISKHAPVRANRALAYLKAIINKAIEWEIYSGSNPAARVKKNKETARDRWVTREEMPRLLSAIEKEANVHIRAAILLYLLTGLRKSEVLTAQWSDISIPRRVLRVRNTKNGTDFDCRLCDYAIKILLELPIQKENQYIIVGRKKGSHLVCFKRAWSRIRTDAGLEDLRVHDLRHTFASWLALQGHSLQLIGKALNHKTLSSTQRYAHLLDSAVSDAVEENGKNLLQHSK